MSEPKKDDQIEFDVSINRRPLARNWPAAVAAICVIVYLNVRF